jgi:hypothetical protein|tara:strand:- start:764 stop:991 length:228 start_codon:yes stop_codon:yes gene_type:complete
MKDRIQLIREAHAKVRAEKGHEITELLSTTQEDVLDEAEHLDALDHVRNIDFDHDENEVDMDILSPAMRELFSNA